MTFYVTSNDSAGTVGKLVIATAVAQLKCVCALAWGFTYLRLSQERQLTSSSTTGNCRHSVALTDSVSVMTPGSG